MATSRVASALAGAVGGAAIVTGTNEGGGSWLAPFMALAQGTLATIVASASKDGAPSASADSSAQIAALNASVKTLSSAVEGVLRAQSAPGASMLLLLGAPVAGAFYYYFRGLGWVTPAQFQQGLDSVQQAVCELVEGVKVQLLERLGMLEVQGEEAAVWRNDHTVVMRDLTAEVHTVHETVDGLERRVEDLQADVSRSARGVELLCEFVASANNSGGAPPPTLQDRFSSYTGLTHLPRVETPANPPLPVGWAAATSNSQPTTGLVASLLGSRQPGAGAL